MGRNEQTWTWSLVLLLLVSAPAISVAYRPGDVVQMSKMGQYHSSRTVWQDVIGRHCPTFAVNREVPFEFYRVAIPLQKPTGYTGADPYKISFQVGKEKFLIPWLLVINRKSSEVPMIDVHLRFSGSDLLGVTAKVVDMPHYYVETHSDVFKSFWEPQSWPKHVLVRYTWILLQNVYNVFNWKLQVWQLARDALHAEGYSVIGDNVDGEGDDAGASTVDSVDGAGAGVEAAMDFKL
ncbi:hypothetical protein CJ030_MR2G009981 [Morella rubra]|uniref:Uncharacterized protein n=1 Tax=Morella rubra TaxID=262757 RepID=A0A6A1WP81_9ROSI|nr:hypothetical protein CJ030_MR2G009981 [Morella rubra]